MKPTIWRRRRFRAACFASALLAIACLIAACGCSTWIAHALVDAPNKGAQTIPAASAKELADLGITRAERIDVGPPSATLDCWIMNPQAQPVGTVLVLHGVRDRKRTQVGLGRKLADEGYRAVLIDLRGHGESTGDFITYGVVESRDLVQALDVLHARDLLHEPVGVIGASFGGACALKLAAIDDRVKAVVAIATYTSLRDVVPNYLKRTGFGWLVSESKLRDAFELAAQLASFDPDQASPLDAMKEVRAPVLLIHGGKDSHIPPASSRLLQSAASAECKLIIVDDANHDTIMADGDGTIFRETAAWLHQHLN